MIFRKPDEVTKLEVWTPRYSDQYREGRERVALLAQFKVEAATWWLIVEFTKAKHLKGQRYCIERQEAVKYPLDSNGRIPCYAVPMSAFKHWDSVAEIKETISDFGW